MIILSSFQGGPGSESSTGPPSLLMRSRHTQPGHRYTRTLPYPGVTLSISLFVGMIGHIWSIFISNQAVFSFPSEQRCRCEAMSSFKMSYRNIYEQYLLLRQLDIPFADSGFSICKVYLEPLLHKSLNIFHLHGRWMFTKCSLSPPVLHKYVQLYGALSRLSTVGEIRW